MQLHKEMAHKKYQVGKNAVSFDSYGDKVAANLFLPENFDPGTKYPAITLVPPATGVKEQTIGVYAQHLSQKGFITLAFDPRGWGESEGIPFLSDTYRIADDTKNSVSYLHTLDFVDRENIFNLGICMGAGFAGLATVMDARVKGLAVVSPYLDSAEEFLQVVGGSTAALRKSILAIAAKGRQAYYETGKPQTTKVVPETEEEIKNTPMPIIADMSKYYLPGKPGSVPNWKNVGNVMTSEFAATWSIFPLTHLFEGIPTVVVYGDRATSGPGAERFYQAINGPKDKLVVQGADHFDLYWKPEYVEPAVEKIDAYLKAQM